MSGRCGSCAMHSAYRPRAITPGDHGRKARARSPIANCRAISGGFMPSTGEGMGHHVIHAELRAAGQSVSRKRVERVMREHMRAELTMAALTWPSNGAVRGRA